MTPRARATLRSTAVLWTAFVAMHVWVAVIAFHTFIPPYIDVPAVYEPWSGCALHIDRYCGPDGWQIVGLTVPWVYPQLALVPLLLAWVFSVLGGYTVGWAVMVGVLDAVAFAVLVGRGTSRGRRAAAWFWIACVLLLGPVGLYRLDGVTVPIALLGALWLVRRPWLGSTLLAAATWIKIWPAALVLAAIIAFRRRMVVVASGAIVSVAILAVALAVGGPTTALGFLQDQADRGIQLEAPVAAPYILGAATGVPGAALAYSDTILTWEVTGPGAAQVAAAMNPLLALAVLALVVVGVVQTRRGASFARLFPTLSLALVVALILFNKVGSPQYEAWLIVPVAVGAVLDRRSWRGLAALTLVIAGATQLVYPLLYGRLLDLQTIAIAVLLIRNALLAVLFVWVCARLVRLPVPSRRATAAASRATVEI